MLITAVGFTIVLVLSGLEATSGFLVPKLPKMRLDSAEIAVATEAGAGAADTGTGAAGLAGNIRLLADGAVEIAISFKVVAAGFAVGKILEAAAWIELG